MDKYEKMIGFNIGGMDEVVGNAFEYVTDYALDQLLTSDIGTVIKYGSFEDDDSANMFLAKKLEQLAIFAKMYTEMHLVVPWDHMMSSFNSDLVRNGKSSDQVVEASVVADQLRKALKAASVALSAGSLKDIIESVLGW